jgi:hypothetical protein
MRFFLSFIPWESFGTSVQKHNGLVAGATDIEGK